MASAVLAGDALPAEGTETRDEWGPTDLRRVWLFFQSITFNTLDTTVTHDDATVRYDAERGRFRASPPSLQHWPNLGARAYYAGATGSQRLTEGAVIQPEWKFMRGRLAAGGPRAEPSGSARAQPP